MDSGKVNLAPARAAKWFKLVGVRLNNGTNLYPNGDEVQTIEPWTPPETWAGMDNATSTRFSMPSTPASRTGRVIRMHRRRRTGQPGRSYSTTPPARPKPRRGT
jgi:hypothetical protein